MTYKTVKHHFTIRPFIDTVLIGTVLSLILSAVPAYALDIHIGTGPEGSFSHFTGRTICRIISRHSDDVECQTVSATDPIDNITNLQGGSLDISLIDSRLLTDAINKTGFFEFMDIRYDNLRELLPLYERLILLLTRGDAQITSLDNLKGRRINAGAPRTEERLAIDAILGAKNWGKEDFSLFGELSASLSQDTMAFCYGEVEAMVHIGVHPNPTMQQLVELCDASPVALADDDIVRMISGRPAYAAIDLPAGIYPAIQKPVATFGTTVFLIASGSLDEASVYQIMEALDRNQQNLKSAHPALNGFTVGPASSPASGVQLHPGAAAYLSTPRN